jgi:hypothetical protein
VLRSDTEAGTLTSAGNVERTEIVDGKPVPVQILPPYREGPKLEHFYQKEDALNPFNRINRDRWQLGPREGFHSDLVLNGFAGNQVRAPETIFKVQFDPELRVPYYSVRTQQAQYHGVASATVVPTSVSMRGLTNLTRSAGKVWDSRSRVTDVDLLSTSGYVVAGERQRHEVLMHPRGEVLTPQLEAGGAASRSFGFVEPGAMTYLINLGGKDPAGEPWNAGIRAYFEHLIHPGNFRIGTPPGGGALAPSLSYSGGPDVALELYTRGLTPLPASGALATGTAAATLAWLLASNKDKARGIGTSAVGDELDLFLRSHEMTEDAGGGPPEPLPPTVSVDPAERSGSVVPALPDVIEPMQWSSPQAWRGPFESPRE